MFSRVRWKPLAFLSAVLVSVVASWLFVGKMRERNTFRSKIVASYQYRFTFAKDWQRTQDTSDPAQGTPESYAFTIPPSPVREWIALHLFRQLPSNGITTDFPPILMVETDTAKARPPYIQIQQGYPEPNLQGAARILSERHFRVDGCPATAVRLEFATGGSPVYGTFLCACLPDYSYTYLVGSLTDQRDRDQANREVGAIIESFHIEHIGKAVPSSSTR